MTSNFRILCGLLLFVFGFSPLNAQRVAPAKLQAAIFLKLLPFDTNLGAEDFQIHVYEEPSVAKELEKAIGTKIGNATLTGVTSGDAGAAETTKVVYFGKMDDGLLTMIKGKKGLSITGNADFLGKGVSLCVGLEGNSPVILLNLEVSKSDGIVWNPAILRVAKIK